MLGFAAVSAVFAWVFTSPMRRAFGDDPHRFLTEFEEVTFAARDGVPLSGWFVPCLGARQAVVLLHGHGSTRTQMLARARLLREHGFAVLLYDARGHGRSGGDLVSFGWFETRDLLGALDYLRTRGFREFGCLGVSMGGATIALASAELHDVRWVVVESVFPTLEDAIDRRFLRRLHLPGRFAGALVIPFAEWRLGLRLASVSPRDIVRQLSCPILVMSGERDEHTTLDQARSVFEAAPEPRVWRAVPGAAHVDLYGHTPAEYERQLFAFLAPYR